MTVIGRLKKFDFLTDRGTRLLAVSKGHPASSIRALAKEGQIDFGESRLQEALKKVDDLKDLATIRWHFIGRIQANKVRGVLKNFDVIHSVDSLKLAERISRISVEENKLPTIMYQVKFREDPAKSGFLVDELLNDWARLFSLPNVKVSGLMTIPPIDLDLNERKNLFQDCRNLANKLALKDCSMGMSSDWKEALGEGSTWVRLGSTLFGDRHNGINKHRDVTKDE